MAFSWLANPQQTRAVLARHDLLPKHRLGQNFLVDDGVIGRILSLAELEATDVVYEIGPGIGTLTVALLSRVRTVVAVEADAALPAALRETCERDGERLALVQGDALRVTPEQLGAAAGAMPNKLVSNLPYQVAATVILKVFAEQPSVSRAVVMVQAEVADRIAARPGTKAYGAYTAKLSLYGRVSGRFEVGPGSFMPPPHVNSAVVRIDRYAADEPGEPGHAAGNPGDPGEPGRAVCEPGRVASVSRVIDAAFAQRRKTIRNSMQANGFDKYALDQAFTAAGIDPRTRAERLGVEDFVRLEASLSACAGGGTHV